VKGKRRSSYTIRTSNGESMYSGLLRPQNIVEFATLGLDPVDSVVRDISGHRPPMLLLTKGFKCFNIKQRVLLEGNTKKISRRKESIMTRTSLHVLRRSARIILYNKVNLIGAETKNRGR
jgi:hypothetical protein